MAVLLKNNAGTTLSGDINNSVTSIGVASSASFPSSLGSDHFYATIDDGTNVEIVKVTAISGTTWTVVRAQDNTSARAFSSGDNVQLRMNVKTLEELVSDKVTLEDLDVTSDSGTIAIDLDSETLTIAGGEGIDTSATSNTVTIAGEDATTSNKGVASFSSDNFAVSSGAVTIKDGGVIAAELASNAVETAKIAADAVTGAKIADDAIDSEHYTDGSIDTAHIADDQVTLAKMAGLARGKIIYGDSSGNPAALALGSNGQVLKSDGTDISWGTDSGLTTEEVQDIVGGMVDDTETGISVTYDDTNGNLEFVLDAAQTTITSIYATDLILGEDAQTAIDFGTANEIDFKVDNAARLTLTASALYPVTNNQIDLGTSSLEFKDAYFDGTVTADAFAGPLTGNVTGNVSGTAATVTGAAQSSITSVGTLTGLTVSGDVIIDTNVLFVDVSTNRVGIGNATPDVSLDIGSYTDAVHLPVGTTAQRPGSPAAGYFRYNSTLGKFEGYTDAWGEIGGGASGSAFTQNTFTGDGSDTTFSLSTTPTSEDMLLVFIDGVFQADNVYSVSGTTLTFATAPANSRVVTAYVVTPGIIGVAPVVNTMTGDNSDTTLTLSQAPAHENATFVTIDGVVQHKSTYAVSGTTLTFSTAPPTGSAVECITFTNVSTSTFSDLDADTKIQCEEGADDDTIRFDVAGTEVLTIAEGVSSTEIKFKGTAPALIIGDAGAEDTKIVFDGNAQDYYIGLDDSADDLVIGKGSAVGTTPAIVIDENLKVGVNHSSPAHPFAVAGTLTSNTNQDVVRITAAATAAQSGGLTINTTYESTAANRVTSLFSIDNQDQAAPLGFGTGTTRNMVIDTTGRVLIGTDSGDAFNADSMLRIGRTGDRAFLQFKTDTDQDSGILFGTTSDDVRHQIIHDVGDDALTFSNNSSESMRLDSSGNLFVGTTSASRTTVGHELHASGLARHTASGDKALELVRTSSDGEIVEFFKDSTHIGTIGAVAGEIAIGSGDAFLWTSGASNAFLPASTSSGGNSDTALDLGSSGRRFNDAYIYSGVTSGSDRNDKQDIASLSDAEKKVAVACKGLLRKWRWKSAVELKGDKARTHFGIIAQDLQDAFTAEGLDAGDYGMFISSTFTDDDGKEQTRLGIRYHELLAFIISAI